MTEREERNVFRLSVAGPATAGVPALLSIIRRLSIAGSLEEIAAVATPAARNLLHADGLTFVLRDGEDCHYVEEDAISPLWRGRRFPLGACISGWCMTEGKAAAIPDITKDPRIPQDAYRSTFVRSLAMVPVCQDAPIAAMGAYWRDTREIKPYELELLQGVANAVAMAMRTLDLRQQAQRSDLARREVSHRLKNVLQIVEVFAHRTAGSAATTAEFVETFLARLHALQRAQTLLDRPGDGGIDVAEVVRDQVAMGGGEDRVRPHGPPVRLPGDDAFDLGLVLHELATNARKHGALSRDAGAVSLEWQVDHDGDTPRLELAWKERGGPAVSAPSHTGFGATLLRHAFARPGGGARLSYEPDGLACRMTIPLRETEGETEAQDPGEDAVADGHAVAAPAPTPKTLPARLVRPIYPAPGAEPERLTRNGVLAAVPDHVVADLAEVSRPRSLEAGELLRGRDGSTSFVHLVSEGLLSLLAEMDGQPQVEVSSVGAEGLLGVSALLGVPEEAPTALAVTRTVLQEVEAPAFLRLMAEHEELRQAATTYAARRFRETTRLVACSARHRLETEAGTLAPRGVVSARLSASRRHPSGSGQTARRAPGQRHGVASPAGGRTRDLGAAGQHRDP